MEILIVLALLLCVVCVWYAYMKGLTAGYVEAFLEQSKKSAVQQLKTNKLIWDVFRLGKTPGLFTYRDQFLLLVIKGKITSLDGLPVDRVNDIYDGKELVPNTSKKV